jgi:type I restriction enzyme M protein
MPSDNARQHTLVDILQPASSGYALDLFTKDEIEKPHVYDKNGKPYLRCLVSDRERPAKPEEIVRQLFLRRITMSAHTPE